MDLQEALGNRPLAIIAGSRFSEACSTEQALRALYIETQSGAPDENECHPWLLGSHLRRTLDAALPTKLEETLRTNTNDDVQTLATLPIDLVLTTSVAQGWERAFDAAGKFVHSIVPGQSPDYDYDAVVYHLFGKTSQPESMLLCGTDFESIRHETDLQSLLQSWWSSRVFVFLGFEAHDEDFRRILQTMLLPRSKGTHFAFMPGLSETESTELREQFGLHLLNSQLSAVAQIRETLEGAQPIAREAADLDAIMARAALDKNDPAVASGFELLEHRLRQAGAHERLVDVHLARLSVAESAKERQQILLETASLLEHKMQDPDRAFHATLGAYREFPERQLWTSLARQATNHDSQDLYAAALMDSRPALRADDREEALLQAVHVFRQLGDTTKAIESIELAVSGSDRQSEIDELHRDLLREAERWYELTRALERAATQATMLDVKQRFLMQRAEVLQDRLGEPWAAIECYQHVLSMDPENAKALEQIERLFLHLHQVPALLDLLYDYGQRHSASELQAKLWRLGEQCRNRGDHTGAALCFEKLRDEEPANTKVLEALTELYAELGETSSLVDILKAKVGAAKAGPERADLSQKLAIAHEGLENFAEAAECWEWVCHDDPESTEAVAALERIYRRSQNWQSLLALYSRQRERSAGQDKAHWILLMAELHQHQLAELGPAIDLLSELREGEPNNSELGARILLLLEHAGRYGEAAKLSDTLAELGEGNAQATLLQHAARLWQQHGESGNAVKSLEAAVVICPDRADLHKALAEALQSQGEHLRAAEAYDKASLLTTGFESTKYALAAARCFENLNATDRGIEVLEHRWLSGSDERIVAVELRRLYESRGRHEDLITLLETQNERVRKEEQLEELQAMADAYAALGQWKEEIACMQRALAAFPERTDIAKQLAEAALAREQWGVAESAANLLLKDSTTAQDKATAYCLLARRSYEMGEQSDALSFLAKARERSPFDRRALTLLVEFSKGQPEAQIGYLRALLLDAPPSERAGLLTKIGDLCRDHLDERAEARDAYHSALLITPDDHLLLHRCLAFAVEDKEWDISLEYLDHLIETESDPSVRARYRSTTAHLHEEELGDLETATRMLWAAADEAPKDLSVLRRLATILRAQKSWQELLDCTSRLLAALRDTPGLSADEHASAWIDLANLCSEHLGDRETALCALEVAVGLLPKNLENRERLAKLYQEDGRFHDAIAQHQSILDLEPSLLPSYNALSRLLEQTGNASAAAACQQAASTMCSETAKHIPIPKQRTAALDNETMAVLRHPEERFALGHLLALLTPAIATTAPRARRRPTFGGRKSLSASHPASIRAQALAEQLGVHPPAVYLDAEAQLGVQTATERAGGQLVPVIIFNKDAAASADSLQTSFLLARALVLLRREYLARAVQPSTKALGHALDAVFELARSEPGVPVSKTATALAKAIDTTTFDQLKILVRKLRPDKHAGFEIVTRWIETSTMSANRVALWLVGDLLTALEGSADETQSKRKAEEARQDLIRSFCSPLIRADMQSRPTSPLTKTPHEGDGRSAGPQGKSQSLRKDFRNIARTVTEEIRLDSL